MADGEELSLRGATEEDYVNLLLGRASGEEFLGIAITNPALSAQACDCNFKVARTITYLAHLQSIRPDHLSVANQCRSLDRTIL